MVIVTKNERYVKELDFSEETLDRRMAKALQEQRVTDESFWDSLSTHVRQTVKKIVEGCLEEEVRMMIGASSYEHSPLREGERSGHYKRDLITRYGLIENLLVPKVRKRKYNGFKVLKRYARRVGDIDELVKEIFLAGVSTRRVREVIKPLLGYQYSPQFVSDILKQLDKEVRKFHERD